MIAPAVGKAEYARVTVDRRGTFSGRATTEARGSREHRNTLNNNIALTTFQALATRAGGEVIPDF